MSVSSLLLLLSFLVEVRSQQTFPYVSFGLSPTLANHSYVDLSTVGSETDNSDSVVCRTDLSTCCSGGQGIHRGDWYFPNGTLLPFIDGSVPIGLGRADRRAIIRHTGGATEPTGIYRCRIATNAVHSDTDRSVGETVYVGLYPTDGGKLKHRLAADINLPIVIVLANTHQNSTPPSLLRTVVKLLEHNMTLLYSNSSIGVSGVAYTGDIIISGEVSFDSDEMTLTCISTGGPATTVTWTRDSITVTE